MKQARMDKILVSFTILIIVLATKAEADDKQIVTIKGGIPGEGIEAHCYSRDDDFGNKVLQYGQEFLFRFKSPFGFSKYWCNFKTSNGSGNYGVWNKNIMDRWCVNCDWLVQANGPCVRPHKMDTQPLQCQPWKKPRNPPSL